MNNCLYVKVETGSPDDWTNDKLHSWKTKCGHTYLYSHHELFPNNCIWCNNGIISKSSIGTSFNIKFPRFENK